MKPGTEDEGRRTTRGIMGMSDQNQYEIRTFPAAGPGEEGFEATSAWLGAVINGFYEKPPTEKALARAAETNRIDGRVLTGVYQRGPVAEGSPGAEMPVATFGTLRKTLNVGRGRFLEAQLITAVTVRASHRRRGLLRTMMNGDLRKAKDDGIAIAALTASEGTIYRRFGFGVASGEREVVVDTSERFRMHRSPEGSVEAALPSALRELAPRIFARVHAVTPGSVDRQERYHRTAAGLWGEDGAEDTSLRAALHYDTSGAPDGYVTYRFKGWEHEPATMVVEDLVAATREAYLGLWEFLGALDLVKEIRWESAPMDDPLPWALADPRCVRTKDVWDMLWLRILDVERALGARAFEADGELVIDVEDALGLTPGRWRLSASGGEARVTATDDAPDLTLDIASLSSVYLGDVSPVILRDAARLTEHRRGAAELAARMFAVERPVHCLTHF